MAERYILDLPAHLLGEVRRFGASLERLTFSELVLLVTRLDRSREAAQRMLARAGEIEGLHPDLVASASDLEVQVGSMAKLAQGELDRRFAALAR